MENEEKYMQFCLVQEMFDTPEIIRNFEFKNVDAIMEAVKSKGKLFLTGEGSSRIFPAKNETVTSLQSFLLSCFSFFTASAPM